MAYFYCISGNATFVCWAEPRTRAQRTSLPRGVSRTVKANRVAIWIQHLGVAGAPERVDGGEVAGVARARQPCVQRIDRLAGIEDELQVHGPSANGWYEPGVIAAGQPVSTKCELYSVRNPHLDKRRSLRAFGDSEAKGAVERHAGDHV